MILKEKVFKVEVASLTAVTFLSSNYIYIFGKLRQSCSSETVVSLELLYLVWDGSPNATGPTEYSKKDWVYFTRHDIIWNDLHRLFSFPPGILETKDIGKDWHLSHCNTDILHRGNLYVATPAATEDVNSLACISFKEATLIYITAQGCFTAVYETVTYKPKNFMMWYLNVYETVSLREWKLLQ